MRKITIALMAGAAVLAGSTAALAQDRDGPAKDMTRADVQAHVAQMFDKLDANKDGKIDQADRATMQKARFDRIDTDHNGSLSFAEFSAVRGGPDGDRGEHRGMRGKRGDGDGHRMGMRGPRGGERMNLQLADANKDGAITLAELQTAALARFDAADANHDGSLTSAERKAQHDTMRDKWRAQRTQDAS